MNVQIYQVDDLLIAINNTLIDSILRKLAEMHELSVELDIKIPNGIVTGLKVYYPAAPEEEYDCKEDYLAEMDVEVDVQYGSGDMLFSDYLPLGRCSIHILNEIWHSISEIN